MEVCLVNHCSEARLAAFWRYIRVTAPARGLSHGAASGEIFFLSLISAGKAGGFLALDWSDGTDTGLLARRSFQLHGELAQQLGEDTGYRRVHTLAVTCSALPGGSHVKFRWIQVSQKCIHCPSPALRSRLTPYGHGEH